MHERVQAYFSVLGQTPQSAVATDSEGNAMPLARALEWAVDAARRTHDAGNTIMFVGNGGSAGIASHMAIDYTKNGGLRALAFNDGAALTCLGNDLGYENVFAKQVEAHGRPGDLLIAISSSGTSANILNAVAAARERDCSVLTMTGFKPDNPLRAAGDLNLYVPNGEYGFVEISHLALCHAIIDLSLGWGKDVEQEARTG
jgi:D-sedoheptulose 7-phosphate isomerase